MGQEGDIEITLKPNWDTSWNDGYSSGNAKTDELPIFAGKENELNRLTGILKKGKNGVIFIGGDRGAGKTSLARKALHEAKKHRKIVTIPINHLLLDPKASDNDLVYETIRQMVRSAYRISSLNKHTALEKLNNDIKLTRILRSKDETEEKVQKIQASIDTRIDFTYLKKIFTVGIINIVFLILLNRLSPYFEKTTIFQNLNTELKDLIYTLINWLGTVIGITALWSISVKKSKKSSQIHEIDGISIHELQERLNEAIEKIEEQDGVELVFLFEELDQFDEKEELKHEKGKDEGQAKNINCDRLLKILKSLKLLFHNSKAQFIFLVGPETFYWLNASPIYKTLPSEKFYISISTPKEFEKYLQDIQAHQNEKSRNVIDHFALLIWKSELNFYSLKQILREKRKFKEIAYKYKNTSTEEIIHPAYYPLHRLFKRNRSDLKQQIYQEERIVFGKLDTNQAFKAALLRTLFPYIETEDLKARETLLDTFKKIIDHYDRSLTSMKTDHLEIDLSDDNIKAIVQSYLNWIFTIGRQKDRSLSLPDIYENRINPILWSQLQGNFKPEEYRLLHTDQIGPILNEEITFVEKYNELLSCFNKITKADYHTVGEHSQRICDRYGVDFTPIQDFINRVDGTREKIENTQLGDRGIGWAIDLANEIIPNLGQIKEYIESKINTEDILVLSKGSWELTDSSIKLFNTIHKPGVEFATIIRFDMLLAVLKRDGKPTIKLKLDEGVIFNLLFGVRDWSNEPDKQEYYMLRYDNRKNHDHAFLYKPSNESSWKVIKPIRKLQYPKESSIKIVYDGSKIKARFDGYNKISSLKIGKIKWLAFANELGDVQVEF